MKKIQNFIIAILATVFAVACVEIFLRVTHSYDSYPEKSGRTYTSLYSIRHHGPNKCITVHPPGRIWINETKEFKTVIWPNSQGFSDKEWSLEKNGCRIVCLGDSYTEGIGSSNDSSYPAILQKRFPSVEVMNFGISGADPVGNLCLLKTMVINYHPDVVTLTINQSDIDEVIVRGGRERFLGTHMRSGPVWEKYYARFRIVRWVVHRVMGLDYLFLTPKQHENATQNAIHSIIDVMNEFNSISEQNGIRCIFVFNPMMDNWGTENMIPIIAHVKSHGYEYVDGIDYFNRFYPTHEVANVLYWEIDGHYRNRGYALLTEVIDSVLRKSF